MPIRNFTSKAGAALLVTPSTLYTEPEVPVVDDNLKDVEKPNTKGLPSGQTWVTPELFPAKASVDTIKVKEKEEAMNDFILAYFSMIEKPTSQQVLALATSVGLSYPELEKRVYSLASSEVGSTSDDIEIQEA